MELERVRQRLDAARHVVAFTGAGVSAESGVPTFRGGGNALVWRGMPAEELSSAEKVRENLPLVWEWFDYRRGILSECAPNAAHAAIASWQDRFPALTLVTQNVDGLHAKAGSRDVLELHGNIWRGRCLACDERAELPESPLREIPPRCARCRGALRPDVVLFGEYLPEGVFERAALAAAASDVFFVVGTSALVYPAAGLPALAARAGAFVVEVNPEATDVSEWANVKLTGKAGELLPQL